MVYHYSKALVQSTQLGFRAGVDIVVYLHGHRGMDGLAERNGGKLATSSGLVRHAIIVERPVDAALLRPATAGPRSYKHLGLVGGHRRNVSFLFPHFPGGRVALSSLLALGRLRRSVERLPMVA